MQDENFEGPPTIWVIGTVIAGIISGIGLIFALEYLSDRLSPQQSFAPHRESLGMTIHIHPHQL